MRLYFCKRERIVLVGPDRIWSKERQEVIEVPPWCPLCEKRDRVEPLVKEKTELEKLAERFAPPPKAIPLVQPPMDDI